MSMVALQRVVRPLAGLGTLFWIILALGAFLRFYELGRASYMIDEINVIRDAAAAESLGQIYESELQRFGWYHRLPLTYWIIHLVSELGTPSDTGFPPEWATRLPMAILGLLTLPFLFLVGRDLRDKSTGLALMFLGAISPYHLFYSREAYDYAVVMFFAAAVVWLLIRLVGRQAAGESLGWGTCVAFTVALVGLLYAHLSNLMFLAGLGVGVVAALLPGRAWKGLFEPRNLFSWALMVLVPVLLFSPFLIRMLGGEWVSTDESSAINKDWKDVLPGVLGRMGWGQFAWTMLPFAASCVGGLAWLLGKDPARRRIAIFLGVTTVVYLAVQAWSMRMGRFEIRYYSAVFPILLALSVLGLAAFAQWIAARVPRVRDAVALAVVVGAVGAWLAPSSWAVTQLAARGHNYKGLAEWIKTNIPQNGIYSYWNVYDGRGVPQVYSTPGRFMAYPTAFSTAEDYVRLQVKERLTAFFTRFPTAFFVETAPIDLVEPARATYDPISRESLFRNRMWLSDPWSDLMIRLRTWPMGEAQWESEWIHKMHISYNTPDDVREVARNLGRRVYHYFGKDWSYTKDQQMNDWLVTGIGSSFFLGTVDQEPMTVRLRIVGAGIPSGCRLTIYGSNGTRLLSDYEVQPRMTELPIPPVQLSPGVNEFMVEAIPSSGAIEGGFALLDIEVTPVSGP